MQVITISGKAENGTRVCSYCGSDNRVIYSSAFGDYLCNKHYMQFYHTKQLKKRFRCDLNEVVLYNTYAEIILYDREGKEKARTKIDLDDVEKSSKIRWGYHTQGYAYGRVNGKDMSLGNFLLNNLNPSLVADHIDHDRLNNQKSNLRLVTYSQNNMNAGMRSNNSSGRNGISYSRRDKLWEAYISIGGKRIEHQCFKDKASAIRKREDWERQYFKEFTFGGDAQ